MALPVAALALVTLGSGLAIGGMSYKRAQDAKKKDKLSELTERLAKDQKVAANETDAEPLAITEGSVKASRTATKPKSSKRKTVAQKKAA